MATTLASKISYSASGTLAKALGLSTSGSIAPKISKDLTLANGTSNDQADKIYFTSGSIALSADLDIDLAGSLTDAYGDALTFAKVKAIIVKNTSDEQDTPTAAGLKVGGGDTGDGTNAFDTWITSTAADGSEAVLVNAGGAFCLIAPDTGYTVTAATADILRLANTSGTEAVYYELMIIGTSA